MKKLLTENSGFGNISEHLARGRRSLKTKQEEKHKKQRQFKRSYSLENSEDKKRAKQTRTNGEFDPGSG